MRGKKTITPILVETVIESAERRQQEVVQQKAVQAEQNHQHAVAQLTGEAVRALEEQAQGHALATDELRREAAVFHNDASNYVSHQQATVAQAREAYASLSRADTSRDKEMLR